MAPRRQSVKNKHAFSYGVCPFCNKNILEGEKNNIEHIFPFSQINDSYGTKLKYSKNGGTGTDTKRIPLNIEKSIRILVHEDCNTQSGHDLENKISNIIKKLQDDSIESKQLTYDDIETIFQYGEKLAKFLPYLPDVIDRITPPKSFNNVRIYPNVLPLGMIVDKTSVAMSFNGVAFVYNDHGIPDDSSINIYKTKHGYMYWFKDDYEQTVIVKENESVTCRTFKKSDLFFPGFSFRDNNQVSILLSPQDVSCLMCSIDKSDIKNFRQQLNLRKLMQFGDISPKLLCAIKELQWIISHGGLTEEDKQRLKHTYRDDIFTKLKWLNENKKFKFPDDVEDMVVYNYGRIQILQDGYLTDTANLQNYTIRNDVLLGGEGLRKIDDLSGCIVDGSVVLSGNNLVNLDGSPSKVTRNFYCDHNQLINLNGAPKHVGGDFDCWYNKLTSLEGAPQSVGGNFYCFGNELTSLAGAPKSVGGNFYCSGNPLTSLAGAPKSVGGNFYCDGNKLESFGCSQTQITGKLVFDAKYLKSLDGLPRAREYLTSNCLRTFHTVDELRAWFTEYKKERAKKKKLSLHTGAKKLKSANTARDAKKQIVPDDQHGK